MNIINKINEWVDGLSTYSAFGLLLLSAAIAWTVFSIVSGLMLVFVFGITTWWGISFCIFAGFFIGWSILGLVGYLCDN